MHGHGNERRQAKSFKLTKLFCGEGDSEAATISALLRSMRRLNKTLNKFCVFLRSNKNITGALLLCKQRNKMATCDNRIWTKSTTIPTVMVRNGGDFID